MPIEIIIEYITFDVLANSKATVKVSIRNHC